MPSQLAARLKAFAHKTKQFKSLRPHIDESITRLIRSQLDSTVAQGGSQTLSQLSAEIAELIGQIQTEFETDKRRGSQLVQEKLRKEFAEVVVGRSR